MSIAVELAHHIHLLLLLSLLLGRLFLLLRTGDICFGRDSSRPCNWRRTTILRLTLGLLLRLAELVSLRILEHILLQLLLASQQLSPRLFDILDIFGTLLLHQSQSLGILLNEVDLLWRS